jgi:RHS repeat-associated protein
MKLRREQLGALGVSSITNNRRAQLFALRKRGFEVVEDSASGAMRVRDPVGGVAQVLQDGYATVVISGEGRRFRFEHDDRGALISLEDPAGLRVKFDHDEAGALRSISRGDHSRFSLSYESSGRIARVEGPDGTASCYQRDAVGRLRQITDRNGHTRHFEYDERGMLAEIVSANGAATRIEYEGGDSPCAIEFPSGDRHNFLYSADGHLAAVHVNGKLHASYRHDNPSGKHEVKFCDGTWASLTYQSDRLVEASNENGTIKLAYDEQGRLAAEEFDGETVRYRRNAVGSLTAIVLPNGEEVCFERDGEQRLNAVTDWKGDRYSIGYLDVGAPASIQYPNGVEQSMTATEMGLVQRLIVKRTALNVRESIEYCRWAYDACDRVIVEDRNGVGRRFVYDREGRLIQVAASEPKWNERFDLDAEGNRLRDAHREYRYNGSNQLIAAGSEQVTHDELGNLTEASNSKGLSSYKYNGRGQLVAIYRGSALVARYAYDGLGRRIRKEVGRTVTRYVWAGTNLLSETTTDGEKTTRRDFLYAAENPTPLAMRVGTNVFYLHPGRCAEPLCATDRHGSVVWRASYSAFGEAHEETADIHQPFRLPGQYYDDESGLHYNVARYFDPRLGRFLTQDPLRVSGGAGLNFYLYCDGDPLNKCDPTGELIPILVGVGILAAIGIGAAINGYREYRRQQEQYGEVRNTLAVVEEAGIGGAAGLVSAVAAIGVVALLKVGAVVAVVGAATAMQAAFLAGVVSGVVGYCTDAALSERREATIEGAGWAAGIGGILGYAGQRLAPVAGSLFRRVFKGEQTVKGFRAVSDAELQDIRATGGLRPHPEGRSMQDKWFSETAEGAEAFRKNYPELKHVVEAEVPKSTYDKSYRHPNIDQTGPGFAVPPEELGNVKVK